ncbi:autotransporter-associated beta strand repeat-containing protein [Variovorax sp. J22R133]|uniref:autotransporter-associated beta strand repeat-containing protein n=1 Tax=Variovorax brevis TaxID=3053503 RepID=UPI0025792373|nr:autotransporter-associated beta strand repeat-containing protein [Variovorax sp. J22R133]MDM0117295.1 autotransporter-associated beta strand repeat-containing protein [Variovorax sp. J22R133]
MRKISSHSRKPLIADEPLRLAGLVLALSATGNVWGACATSGLTVTCDTGVPNPWTTLIGSGPNTATAFTVTLNPGAQISVSNASAISLNDGAIITLGDNTSVTNNATIAGNRGLHGAGDNTIEFGSNGRLTIGNGASVSAIGTQNIGEPINVMGVGNVITNDGTISSRSGAAIWFEDKITGGTNAIDNFGIIRTQLGTNSNVIGNSSNGSVTFTNRTGARVEGSLSFASGNDQLTLEAGSVITGSFNGGGGTNTLNLSGAVGSSDSLPGDIRNFQTLTKTGGGIWTLTGSIGANGGGVPLQVLLSQGTLALTGSNSSFNGSITVNPAGTLAARAQSLPPLVTDNGLVRFVQDNPGTYTGRILGSGSVEKTLGGTVTLSGANNYTGGTAILSGTILISADANLGAATGPLTLNSGTLGVTANVTTGRATTLGPAGGTLGAAAGTTLTHSGFVTGSGDLSKTGAGTLALTGSNTYAGTTVIEAGVLQVGADINLGAPSSNILFSGGTLRTTTDTATGRVTTVDADGGTIETVAGTGLAYNGTITGPGTLTKIGTGTLNLTAANSQGGTAINAGVVQISSDANLGAPAGQLSFNGGTLQTLNGMTIAHATMLNAGGGTFQVGGESGQASALVFHNGLITGPGGLAKTGTGSLLLNGANSYTGPTAVTGGVLFVNGNQTAATGPMTVTGSSTRLSGAGIIGGDVTITGGAAIGPALLPFTPATLTINGNLTLSGDSALFYNLVEANVAGGPLNDLLVVGGNLTLDGTFNVLDQRQEFGDLGPGVYRIINYGGTLTDNGLTIGSLVQPPTTPVAPLPPFIVQTSIAHQVNLVNATGLTLNYWDGAAGPKNDGLIAGGNGVWQNQTGNDNWTTAIGTPNAAFSNGDFAIFAGAPGTVTVDTSLGAINVSGMQFATDGYQVQGGPIQLVGTEGVVRVGDGTSASTGMTATVNSVLSGSASLSKTDLGTLVLSGANTYTGGTQINGGVLQVASDGNLGDAAGALGLDSGTLRTTANMTLARATSLNDDGGTFETAPATTLNVASALGGAGALTKTGAGTLLLSADNTYAGGTTISAGTLQLGNGGTTGSVSGAIVNDATLAINRSNTLVLGDGISGLGSLVQAGTGTTILSAANTYFGGTTISTGTLQLGNGGTTGSVVGNVVDNATLAFNRSDQSIFAGVISGTGGLNQVGSGTTILTGSNGYAGNTVVSSGSLYIDGDQTAAAGPTNVANGARLGGNGIVGGAVVIADGATLAPGILPGTPATLTINGSLNLSENSILAYNLVEANVEGGLRNDLTVVRGNLTLDGVINVIDENQTLLPGVYRLINYSGALTNNGLRIGNFTPDGRALTGPITGFAVQTAVSRQVNLVSTSGLALTYWDGTAGPKNDGVINGGNGFWRRSDSPNDQSNFTGSDGAVNAPWSTGGFAIFTAAPGTVTVDAEGGPNIEVSGMQFASDGYVIQGDPIALVGGSPDIRVGDGTAQGAGITATINSVITGATAFNKIDSGTLVLGAANTLVGGINVLGGTLQISSNANLGEESGRLTLDNGTLRTTADMRLVSPTGTNRAVQVGPDGGTFETQGGTTLTVPGAIDGTGSLAKTGDGTLVLAANNIYSGGTTISAGTLQLGNGGTTGSVVGAIVDNARLVVNRSDTFTFPGAISGTGSLEQAGPGGLMLINENTYTGGTTISAGTLQIGDGGTTGSIVGNVAGNGTLVFNRSDVVTFSGAVSGTGRLEQQGSGTTIVTGSSTYTGGTTVSAGTLQIGDGGTTGSIVGNVADNGTLVFNRSDAVTFSGAVSGTGRLEQLGSGTTILTGNNTYTGGTTVSAGTLQIGDGGTTGAILGDVLNEGIVVINRADDLVYGGVVSGIGSAIKAGAGRFIVTANQTYTGGTTISGGALQIGNGGTSGSVLGDIVDNAALVINRSDQVVLNGTISGTGSFEQAGTGTTVFGGANTYTGGTLISAGTLQVGNGSVIGNLVGDVVDNGILSFNRADSLTYSGTVSGSGELVQAGLGTLILTASNSHTGGTAIEEGTLQISSDANLGAATGDLRLSGGTLVTTATISSSRPTVLAQRGGTFATAVGTTLTMTGIVDGAGGLTKSDAGGLVLTGANSYAGPTTVTAGTLLVNGDQTLATGLATVQAGARLGGIGKLGGSLVVADGGTLAPGQSPGTITVNGDLNLSPGSVLDYEFGRSNVVGGPLNDLTVVGGNLALDGTINVTISPGGLFDPGVYRVISYAGTLTNNGLQVGTIPSPTYSVQTSIPNQVNLVNTTGLTLNFWDGAAGARNDGLVAGGDGLWQHASGNDNWTTDTGTPNAGFSDAAFAIFMGAPGTVTADPSLGAINVSGMQFATGGYVVQGQSINLAGSAATIRVGDGTDAGLGMTATINSVLTGSAVLMKSDLGTLILSGANTYTGGTEVNGGVLQVASDASLGAAAGSLKLDGGTLRTTSSFDNSRATILGALGGTLETANDSTLTLNGPISGEGSFTKAGDGTLILSSDNSYAGGSQVKTGVLQVASDANLGAAAGALGLDGGTLRTTRSFTSSRVTTIGAAGGSFETINGTTLTLNGALSGTGGFTKAGDGTLVFTADNAGYAGPGRIAAGTLAVDGALGSLIDVQAGGRLEGNGRVGGITNSGVVAPGRSFGVLTAAGNYVGNGGRLEIEAQLGGDASPADRLVIGGGTSGGTLVMLLNRNGPGAQTVEGIKVIDVAGPSDGSFTLEGDYIFQGQPTVIAGAYGYQLQKNGIASPNDGDWYLRSTLLEQPDRTPPPLFQPGVPVYEAYPQTLLALNGLPTLQQRVGNRTWIGDRPDGRGAWIRTERSSDRPDGSVSTSMMERKTDRWEVQAGIETELVRDGQESVLIGGITAHYGKADTDVRSIYGDGTVKTEGHGAGLTLTWYGPQGVYVDAQAQMSTFQSDLRSVTLGNLAKGNDGIGKTFSAEAGQRIPVNANLSVTPQVQLQYSSVDFDRFTDPAGAVVSASSGDSLRSRLGISLDRQDRWAGNRRSHVYGLVNLNYEWLNGTRADVSGTPIISRDNRLWGEFGLGGSFSWVDSQVILYGEVSVNTPMQDFGDHYSVKAAVGVRIGF